MTKQLKKLSGFIPKAREILISYLFQISFSFATGVEGWYTFKEKS